MRENFPSFACLFIMVSGFLTFSISPAVADDSKSTISYGLITSKIKNDVTTQEDIIALLGGPNIVTTDTSGNETWVYDKVSTETVHQGTAQTGAAQNVQTTGAGGASGWGVGIPLIAGYEQGKYQGSASLNQQVSASAQDDSKRTTTTKNLTLIIKFNANKTVKNYSVRSASF